MRRMLDLINESMNCRGDVREHERHGADDLLVVAS